MKYIHPASQTRSKLSVHLRSQTAPSPNFSMAAATELLGILKSRGIAVDEGPYLALSAREPPLFAVKGFWATHFKTLPDVAPETVQFLLTSMDRCCKDHPSDKDNFAEDGKLQGNYKHIHDVAAFKASLATSRAAVPVAIYSDLDARL